MPQVYRVLARYLYFPILIRLNNNALQPGAASQKLGDGQEFAIGEIFSRERFDVLIALEHGTS